MTQLKSVLVTQSIQYDPESYLEYCQEYQEEPTQSGFLNYIQDWIEDDFNSNYDTTITELE